MSKTTTWKNKSPIPESDYDKKSDTQEDDLDTFRDKREQLSTNDLTRDFNYREIPGIAVNLPVMEGMGGGTDDMFAKKAKTSNKTDTTEKSTDSDKTPNKQSTKPTGTVVDRTIRFFSNGDPDIEKELRNNMHTIMKDGAWFVKIGNSFVDAGKKLKDGDGYQLGKMVMMMFMCVIYSIMIFPSLILFSIRFSSLIYMVVLRRMFAPNVHHDEFQKAIKLNESYCLNFCSMFVGLFITLNWWYVLGYKTTYVDFAHMLSSVAPLNFMFEHAFVSLHMFNYLTSVKLNVGSPALQDISAFCWEHRPFVFFALLSIITAVYINGGSQINSSFMGTVSQNGSIFQKGGSPNTASSIYDGLNFTLVLISFLMMDLFNLPRLMFRMKTFASAIITGILLLVKLLFAIMFAGIGIQFALSLIVVYSFAGLFVSDFNIDIFKKINIIFVDLSNTVEETEGELSFEPKAIYRLICNNLISFYLFMFAFSVCAGNAFSILRNVKDANLQSAMFISTLIFSGIVLSYFSIWDTVQPYIDVLFRPFIARVFGNEQ